MKKITYLVAPLMVLPFLVGCNKGSGKTHTVTIASELTSEKLSFTDAKNNELAFDSPITVNEGQDFVFNVNAKSENDLPTNIVHQDYIIAVRGVDMDLLTLGFEQGEDKTTAKFTIHGKDITDDISLVGAEYKEGYYLCAFPYILGTSVASVGVKQGDRPVIRDDDAWYGYVPKGSELHFTFAKKTRKESIPLKENILLSRDLKDIETPKDDDGETAKTDWATYYYYDILGIDINALIIKANTVESSLFISARGISSTILDDLTWAEIAEISEGGYAKDYFNYGETKTIEVNGHEHLVKIIGFNHDHYKDENGQDVTAGITFQFATAISDAAGNAITTAWNEVEGSDYSTANNDFTTSTLNKTLAKVELPEDLTKHMKTVSKIVGAKDQGGNWGAKTYDTNLFPLAECEAYIKPQSHEESSEGYEYEAYTAGYNAGYAYSDMRVVTDANGKRVAYWTRSPLCVNVDSDIEGHRVYAIEANGSGSNSGRNCYSHAKEFGMAPAFCI